MSAPVGSVFDSVLRRMYEREGVDTLAAHLQATCGIAVTRMSQLDVGVFRVDRHEATPLVARLFPSARSHAAAEADLAVLRYLADVDFPAERPIGDGALTVHEGQSLLLTGFVKEVPKAKRPPYPIVGLGSIIGRLHGLTVPAGADRPSGALHHFAEGTMTDELRAVASWLDSLAKQVPDATRDAIDELGAAVDAADGGDGLPEAFVHPDPVPKNVIFTGDGPCWSTGRPPGAVLDSPP